MSDIVLITAMPECIIADGLMQLTFVSGEVRHIFRLSRFRARSTADACLLVCDEADRKPSNVRRFKGKRGHGD